MTSQAMEVSKKQINRAGVALCTVDPYAAEYLKALETINGWRSAHALPLNAIQMNLRTISKKVCGKSKLLIAQRLKRIPSIVHKLRHHRGMQLSRMQDIGGCRSVVSTVAHVQQIFHRFLHSRTNHELVGTDDYIEKPKLSGYRGIHLVYRYCSQTYPQHNGMLVEVQLRTHLQHAWATGTETVGAFIKSPLKSSIGPDDWLRFFALLGSAFALSEKKPVCPGTPTDHETLRTELRELDERIDAVRRLVHFGTIIKHLTERGSQKHGTRSNKYYLMHLKPAEHSVLVHGFRSQELSRATERYLAEEERASRNESGEDVVLVTVDSMNALKRAYPNYFFDTSVLVNEIKRFLTGSSKR